MCLLPWRKKTQNELKLGPKDPVHENQQADFSLGLIQFLLFCCPYVCYEGDQSQGF